MRLLRENTTALFIDIQEKLFPAMAEKEILLHNLQILIQGLTILEVPLTFTQQYTKGLGETIEKLRSLVHSFSAIEKTDFSCYDENRYREQLEQSQAKTVLICGIESHVCVLQTAVDLKQAGYHPVVITDCITSRSLINKQGAIDRFRTEGVLMATYESLLFELTRSSQSEVFRMISKLVK